MSKIDSIDDIETIIVHWSENVLINDEMGCDDNCDINKDIEPRKLDELLARAVKQVNGGYDKTSLTVKLKSGVVWAKESKFYLNREDCGLMSLLLRGQ